MPAATQRIIDGHVHLTTLDAIDGFAAIGKASGVSALAVACICEGDQRVNLLGLLAKALAPADTFVMGGLDHAAPADFAAQARRVMALGGDGIKMIEGKPTSRKTVGLPLNASDYDGLYRYLEAEGVALLLHVADPEEFWDEDKAPDFAKANNWLYTDPSFPSKQQLYDEAGAVLRRYPKLRVILAHFFFLAADLDRARRFLDRHPSVCFDITPGSEMYYHFSKKAKAWRDFFVQYQDRIVFGTDNTAHTPAMIDWAKQNVKRVRDFLATDTAFSGAGLALPADVLDKIYHTNFERIVGPAPRPLAREPLQAALRKLLDERKAAGASAAKLDEVNAMLSRLAGAAGR
jgi:predicted TIM-barrel fold metal-dependent hydrolase